MGAPDDDTLREWIAAADPAKPWPGRDAAHDARLEELACAAPSLAAEVLRLRERAEMAEAAVRAWAEADDAVTAAEPLDALDAMERRAAAGLRLHALALEVGR